MFIKEPMAIETKSFEIITEEYGPHDFTPAEWMVVQRVIHTTADFDYGKRICFLNEAVLKGIEVLKTPQKIYCDTQMALSGVNKKALSHLGHDIFSLVSHEEVVQKAKETGDTRSKIAMEMAIYKGAKVFVIGNAPTALLALHEEMKKGFVPQLIVGTPVGFVGAEESKELFMDATMPCILIRGRKGGSSVAASIVNALMYQIEGTRG